MAERVARGASAQSGIVAMKGLGGFHLACDASQRRIPRGFGSAKAVSISPSRLWCAIWKRPRQIAFVDDEEAKLLTSRERPIVLLRKRAGSPLSDLVAPGNYLVGVMLPYTPLHYLLLVGLSILHGSDSSDHSDHLTSDHSATCNLQPATCHSGPHLRQPLRRAHRQGQRRGAGAAGAVGGCLSAPQPRASTPAATIR